MLTNTKIKEILSSWEGDSKLKIEPTFGAGQGKNNVVLITLGTGLGSGVVIDGNVLYRLVYLL